MERQARPATETAFYFDLASPLAYLAAEQTLGLLGGVARWTPVLTSELPVTTRFDAFRCQEELAVFQAEIGRRAEQLGLQPVRWPSRFPFDSSLAMRAAIYAESIGRLIPFAQAAFRQAFAGGHDLADLDFVLIAAAACEMHPRALIKAIDRPSIQTELKRTTAAALADGVSDVPAIRVGTRIFCGERAVLDAVAHRSQLAEI